MDTVSVRVRLLDSARFKAEAKADAEAIENIGESAKRSERHANRFGGRMNVVQSVMASAKGMLANVSASFSAVSTSAEQSGQAFAGMGVHAGGLSASLGSLGSAAAILGPALLGLAVVVMAGVGALTALAGSAAAAGLALGALATGGVAVLGTGLLGVGLIVKTVAGQFTKVSTALDAYNLSIAQYGRYSKQAIAAQQKLNAVVGQEGGAAVLHAVRQWRNLTETFSRATGPARAAVAGLFSEALGVARRLTPQFAAVTNRAAGALAAALHGPLMALGGPEMQASLRVFGDTFNRIVGPLAQAAMSVFTGLLRIARAAAPYLVSIADGAARAASGFADWASTGAQGFVAGVVDQLKSWWGLAVAIGGLMVTILSGGASSGKSLVDSLTGIVDRFNAWLNTAGGQASMRKFFADSVTLVVQVARAIGPVVGLLLALTRAFMPVVSAVSRVIAGFERVKVGAKSMADYIGLALKGIAMTIFWPFTLGISLVTGRFRSLIAFFRRIPSAIAGALGSVPGIIGHALGSVGGSVARVAGFASGGMVGSTGMYLVGERGPELVTMPGGAYVTPNHQLNGPSMRAPRTATVSQGGPSHAAMAGGRPIHVHVHSTLEVDREVLATNVNTAVAHEDARS